MNAEARQLIAALGLEPLPREGGFFRVTWRTSAGSAIYFLLTDDEDGFSGLHRLKTDELWHFHAGDPVEQVQLDSATGMAQYFILGTELLAGQVPQLVAPGGVWQGSRLNAGTLKHGWALMSCTLAPPWADGECEFGGRAALTQAFPEQAEIVRALTRE